MERSVMSSRVAQKVRRTSGGIAGLLTSLFPPQGKWTEESYLLLPETNRIVELSNGRLVAPDLPSDLHQYAVGELFAAMRAWVGAHGLGHIRVVPLRVRLWPYKIREPDIVFLSLAHQERRGSEYWGVPDLAVEVISPRTDRSSGTERADRVEKFDEYAKAGVSEYWLVDLAAATVEVYVLRDEEYHLLGKWGRGAAAYSETLAGFQVNVSDVLAAEA